MNKNIKQQNLELNETIENKGKKENEMNKNIKQQNQELNETIENKGKKENEMNKNIKQQNQELNETIENKGKKENEMKKVRTHLTQNEINYIEELFGYVFNKKELLEQAFTRKSFGIKNNVPYNELFKKIGESVIYSLMMKDIQNAKFIMQDGTEYNIIEDFSEFCRIVKKMNYNSIESFFDDELKMSFMSNDNLSVVVQKYNLQDLMIIDEGDMKNNVTDNFNIISDLFKSIIGAIACDSNWNFDIIENILKELLYTQRARQILNREMDYVATFHNWYHLYYQQFPNFTYDLEGNIHKCRFTLIDLEQGFIGEGNTKKSARRDCCKKIINYLDSIDALNNNNKIAFYISKLTKENSVVMMNNLYKKGLIPEPKYNFTSSVTPSGETSWVCGSNLGFLDVKTNIKYHFPSHQDSSKNEAKKMHCFIILGTISGFLDDGLNIEIISD